MINIKDNLKLILEGDELFINYVIEMIRHNFHNYVKIKVIDNNLIEFCQNNKDNVNVKYIIANMYMYGYNVIKDKNKGFELLNDNKDENNKFIYFGLAEFYNPNSSYNYKYTGGKLSNEKIENIKKAIFRYNKSIEKDCLIAMYTLALIYHLDYNAYEIEKNYELAFELYKKSADREYVGGEISLGNMYYYGYGCVKDIDEAFFWYTRSWYNKYNHYEKEDICDSFKYYIYNNPEIIFNKWMECEELKKYIIHLESKPPSEKGKIYEEAETHFESQINLLKN